MQTTKKITPLKEERPTSFADRSGRLYSDSISTSYKKENGQFLTPVQVADFMASLSNIKKEAIRILDPGAGSSILSCALCEYLTRNKRINKIQLVTYETDKNLAMVMGQSLKYLKRWLHKRDVLLKYEIKTNDFIISNSHALIEKLDLFSNNMVNEEDLFDIVISNPPYFKISRNDPRAKAVMAVVYGQPNIYSLFLAVSAGLLKKGGELIFITPRSYTAGQYFRLFREKLFSLIRPELLHLFGSRTEAFDRDSVLQENLILKGKRASIEDIINGNYAIISHSNGLKDLIKPEKRRIPLKTLIDFDSYNKILFTPITDEEERIIEIAGSWKGSLHKFGMEISTGPVVPFRATKFIDNKGKVPETHAPLIWMHNFNNMSLSWPSISKQKEQYIKISSDSMPLLLPNKNYTLLRRFSAKEEKHRLNAAPFISSKFNSSLIGFENHVNYIHRPNGNLSKEEAYGLAAILNSDFLDTYFRCFNGNTQVSATEIRGLPLPSLDIIKGIGKETVRTGLIPEYIEKLTKYGILKKSFYGKNRRSKRNSKELRVAQSAAK